MKHYDVFKSQGGYGVAIGIYLDSPVMGTIRWFETEPEAQKWASNKKKYDEDLAEAQEIIECCGTIEEAEKVKLPQEADYHLEYGIWI